MILLHYYITYSTTLISDQIKTYTISVAMQIKYQLSKELCYALQFFINKKIILQTCLFLN